MVLLGKIMILQGVGHPISCLGVCYANDPPKGGYTTPAPALDLTTSLRGDFRLSVCAWSQSSTMAVQGSGPVVYTLVYYLASVATVVVIQTILTVLFNPLCSCNPCGRPCGRIPEAPTRRQNEGGKITEPPQIGRTNRRDSETQQIGRTNPQNWPNSAADFWGGGSDYHPCITRPRIPQQAYRQK